MFVLYTKDKRQKARTIRIKKYEKSTKLTKKAVSRRSVIAEARVRFDVINFS